MEENTDVVIPSTEVSPEVPLATRLHMVNDELQLSKQKYMQIDDAVMASYDELISKYTPKQLKFKQEAESGVTSDALEIGRSTYENFIINTLNLPEKLVMATGNIMTLAPDGKIDTVGKQWASWASQAINDYVDANYLSENLGDSDTWTAKITGGVLSAAEYMALGYVGGAILANSVMGADVLGNSTMNDIDRYIAETGDTTLSRYNADWKDVALNILNTGVQVYIEDKLGFGRALRLKSAGASEALAGFSQEFLQGEIDDVVEAFKKNKSWEDVLKGFVGNIKDGVIGGVLQGATGMASHQHYVSVAERNMTDFFVKNGMDEKTAQQEAHKLRIRFEKEIAPQVFKRGKDIYDLVTQKGAVWGSVYDVAYNAIRLTDDMSMTADEIQNRATEIANQIASKVIDSVVENGTDLADVRIGFNPVDNSVYVNDKKSLDIKQALKEIQELDAEPATKEDVKKAVEEEKKAEEKTETEKQKPVSAVDPKAPFNKTKEKSPVFTRFKNALADGLIKLTKTEQIRYQNLLKDRFNVKKIKKTVRGEESLYAPAEYQNKDFLSADALKSPILKRFNHLLTTGVIKLQGWDEVRYSSLMSAGDTYQRGKRNKPATIKEAETFARKMLEKYAPQELEQMLAELPSQTIETVEYSPTTNEQMEDFAQKMLDKYMPSEVAEEKAPVETVETKPVSAEKETPATTAETTATTPAQPETQDRSRWQEGEKKRKQVERLEKDTGVSFEDIATDSVERIKAEQEEASRLIKENGVQYAEKVLKGEIKSDIITGAWVMALDTAASEGNMEAALLLSTLPEIKGEIVMLSEYARQLAGWKNMMKDSMVSVLDVEKTLETNIKKSIGEKKAQKNVAEMKAKLKTAVESALQSNQLEQNSNSFLDSKVC